MDLNLGLKMALKLILLVLYQYAIKYIQCYNINVTTFDPLMVWQKPAKNPMQKPAKNSTKIHGKNLLGLTKH
jgi:hypothetical protein